MKENLLMSIAGALGIIAFSASFYFFVSTFSPGIQAYWVFGVVLLIMIISLVVSAKKLSDELKGIPGDDEMTRKINREAAYQSITYVLSLWVFVLLISNWVHNSAVLIGTGILIMIIIYAGYWFHFRIKGITDADEQD